MQLVVLVREVGFVLTVLLGMYLSQAPLVGMQKVFIP